MQATIISPFPQATPPPHIPPPRPRRSLRRLIRRCCMAGTAFGAATGATYLLFRRPLIRLFTGDAEVAALLGGSTWTLVAAMQPCNGLVFVLDG